MAIHSSGQTIFSLSHIEGITLGACEEVDKVAGGASGILFFSFINVFYICLTLHSCRDIGHRDIVSTRRIGSGRIMTHDVWDYRPDRHKDSDQQMEYGFQRSGGSSIRDRERDRDRDER